MHQALLVQIIRVEVVRRRLLREEVGYLSLDEIKFPSLELLAVGPVLGGVVHPFLLGRIQIAANAGLALAERWSTWDRDAWDTGNDYAVSVHRRAPDSSLV
ncbi:MAG: hypothetical protein WD379_06760 [Dehalococcoidia bacterium]